MKLHHRIISGALAFLMTVHVGVYGADGEFVLPSLDLGEANLSDSELSFEYATENFTSAAFRKQLLGLQERLANQQQEQKPFYTLEELEERREQARELMKNALSYAQLGIEEKSFLLDYFSLDAEQMSVIESVNFPVGSSITYGRMSQIYQIDASRLIARRQTNEARDALWAELDSIYQTIDEPFIQEDYVREIIAYVVDDQLSAEDAYSIYSLSKFLGISSTLLRPHQKDSEEILPPLPPLPEEEDAGQSSSVPEDSLEQPDLTPEKPPYDQNPVPPLEEEGVEQDESIVDEVGNDTDSSDHDLTENHEQTEPLKEMKLSVRPISQLLDPSLPEGNHDAEQNVTADSESSTATSAENQEDLEGDVAPDVPLSNEEENSSSSAEDAPIVPSLPEEDPNQASSLPPEMEEENGGGE